KERVFADLRVQPKSLEFVLHRILELGKAQLDSRLTQGLVELLEGFGCGDIDAGDRFRRYDHPVHGSRRFRHRLQNALFEQLRVGEEQGRIPAKEDQTGDLAGVRVARDVVVALDALGAAQDRGVRTPAIPQELDDGDHDREADARDGAENGDPDETAEGRPELPALDA